MITEIHGYLDVRHGWTGVNHNCNCTYISINIGHSIVFRLEDSVDDIS